MLILIDTREKKISHLLKEFKEKEVKVRKCKLDYGDYSCGVMIENNIKTFEDKIVVERKSSLEELSSNVSRYRDRFERELKRGKGSRFYLLIEDDSWKDIFLSNYNTQLNYKSYIATLMSYLERYNIDINFVEKEYVGNWLYNLFYYFIREELKEGR